MELFFDLLRNGKIIRERLEEKAHTIEQNAFLRNSIPEKGDKKNSTIVLLVKY
jgi:hypothetical protein